MPFQVVYTNTFTQPNPPNIEEYLGTLGTEVLAGYSDAAGRTPSQVYSEDSAKQPIHANASSGFVSESITTSNDGRSTALTQVWDNQASWLATRPATNNGNVTVTALMHIKSLYKNAYISNVSVTTANI